MWKDVVRQYVRAYKWSRLAEQSRQCPEVIFFPIWLLIIMAESLPGSGFFGGIGFFLAFFPMMHIYLSGVMHEVRLNKMMYLCPMDSAGRRKRIRRFYYFRIGFHMALALAGILAMIPIIHLDIWTALGILCNDFVISCLLPWEKAGKDRWDVTQESLYKIVIIYVAGCCNEILMSRLLGGALGSAMLLFAVLMFIQIPLCIRYYGFIKAELECAVEYEDASVRCLEMENGGGI